HVSPDTFRHPDCGTPDGGWRRLCSVGLESIFPARWLCSDATRKGPDLPELVGPPVEADPVWTRREPLASETPRDVGSCRPADFREGVHGGRPIGRLTGIPFQRRAGVVSLLVRH